MGFDKMSRDIVTTSLRIDKDTYLYIKAKSKRTDISINKILNKYIEEGVDKDKLKNESLDSF